MSLLGIPVLDASRNLICKMQFSKPSQSPYRREIWPSLLPLPDDLGHSLIETTSTGSVSTVKASGITLSLLHGGLIQRVSQVQDAPTSHQRLFVIIFDVNIDDVHRSVQGRTSTHKIINNGIPASFLTSDYHVYYPSFYPFTTSIFVVFYSRYSNMPVLPPLRAPLDIPVSLKHVQEPIGTVETRVLGFQFFVHAIVGCLVELVDVGLVYGRTWQTDKRACAERDYGIVSCSKSEMRFHRSVLVACAYRTELKLESSRVWTFSIRRYTIGGSAL